MVPAGPEKERPFIKRSSRGGMPLVVDDLLKGSIPVVRVNELAETIAHTNVLLGGRSAAQASPHEFPGFVLVLHDITYAPAASTTMRSYTISTSHAPNKSAPASRR